MESFEYMHECYLVMDKAPIYDVSINMYAWTEDNIVLDFWQWKNILKHIAKKAFDSLKMIKTLQVDPFVRQSFEEEVKKTVNVANNSIDHPVALM